MRQLSQAETWYWDLSLGKGRALTIDGAEPSVEKRARIFGWLKNAKSWEWEREA